MSKYRLIIAGSRDIDGDEAKRLITGGLEVGKVELGWNSRNSIIVTGGARGIDTVANRMAICWGLPTEVYPADWGRYGFAAGPRRNIEMAEIADGLLAIWDGKSRGTDHMINTAVAKKMDVVQVTPDYKRVENGWDGVIIWSKGNWIG